MATVMTKADGWTVKQIQVVLLLQTIFIIDGIDTQLLSVSLPAINSEWHQPLADFGNAMGSGHLGALFGTPLAGFLSDKIGRKPVLVMAATLFGLMTIALSFATSPGQLALFHLIAGLGLGGCLPPALALITETTHASRRGMAVALSMVCPPTGIALAGILATTVIPAYGWRTLFVICGSLPLVSATLVLLFLPESPAFLARSGKHEHRLTSLLTALGIPRPEIPEATRKTGFLQSLGTIFAPGNRLMVAGLFAAFVFEYLAMSLVLAWLPSMFSSNGYPASLAATSITAYSLAGIAGIVLTGWAITRMGERFVTNGLIAGGIITMSLLMVFLPAPANLGGSATVMVYVLIGTAGIMLNGLMTALFTGATGAFSPMVRATGIGLVATIARFGAMFGGKIGPKVISFAGTGGYFLTMACILMLILVAFNISRFARAKHEA